MSNEKFKVKFGLAVGDTAVTVDATTGDIVTIGDVSAINYTGETVTINTNAANIGNYPFATPLQIFNYEDSSDIIFTQETFRGRGGSEATVTPLSLGDQMYISEAFGFIGTWGGYDGYLGSLTPGWSYGNKLIQVNNTDTATDGQNAYAQYGYSRANAYWLIESAKNNNSNNHQEQTNLVIDGNNLRFQTLDTTDFFNNIDSNPTIQATTSSFAIKDYIFSASGLLGIPNGINAGDPFLNVFADNFQVIGQTNNQTYLTVQENGGDVIATVSQLRATQPYNNALINFTTQRSVDGINYTPTQNNDTIGEFKFNGNAYTSTTPGVPSGPGASISAYATENWSSTANGTGFYMQAVKTGTLNSYGIINGTTDYLNLSSDNLYLQDHLGTGLVGNKINYNRVYGQWQYDATVTPAASNTAYAYPIASGTQDFANIASVGSTSHIIPGAAGMYKLQFSLQVENSDNGTEHTAYIWWRKNGTDVPSSMGRVTVPKGGATIAGWDNMISSANTTDYWELMYATDDATHISFPYYTATAFGPSTASLFITLVPIGA